MISDSLLILIVNNSFIFAGLLVRYLYYSKCKSINFPCCQIDRDIIHEQPVNEINNNNSNRNLSNV